jgi:hypothetical protein
MYSTEFEVRAVKVRRQLMIRFTATLILEPGTHPDDPNWLSAFCPLEQGQSNNIFTILRTLELH